MSEKSSDKPISFNGRFVEVARMRRMHELQNNKAFRAARVKNGKCSTSKCIQTGL